MIAKTPLYAAFFVFVSVLQNRVSPPHVLIVRDG